jgi:hypothetical protein
MDSFMLDSFKTRYRGPLRVEHSNEGLYESLHEGLVVGTIGCRFELAAKIESEASVDSKF